MTYNGVDYAYIYNVQGDVIALVDSTGAKVVEYYYDAWGKILSVTGTLATTLGTLNPFRYRGYVFDEETGLYYLRSRYYNPDHCRFINADGYSIPSQFRETLDNKNLYAYCNNKPINQVDTSGYFGLLAGMIIGAVVGALVGGVVSAVSQHVNEGEVNWGIVAVDAVSGALSGALSATAIGLGASVAANAALGTATYVAEQRVKDEEITVTGLVAGTVGGAVSGFIGGSGVDSKGLEAAWKGTTKGIDRELRRANAEYAAKQIARYTTERIIIKKTVATAIVKFAAGSVGGAMVNNKMNQIALMY